VSIRVAIAGAYGKTGSVVDESLVRTNGIEVVGRLVRDGKARSPNDYPSVAQLHAGAAPQVLVDFTVFPDSKSIALAAIEAGIRPVIGTSGYRAGDIAELRAACERRRIGAVLAPNFSPGAVLMMQFAHIAGRFFTTAEIVETHQTGKKDAPSGTALATAERIAEQGTFRRPAAEIVKAEGARGADVKGVGIHSLRLPGVIATQEVLLANEDETLSIRHVTSTRRAFVPGVIAAVHAAADLERLIVGLEELLG
jgi:4-hydroxy-tetrahydrodipicolinate reductase